MNLAKITLALSLVLPLAACDLLGPPVISGKAVDGAALEENSIKPIAEAIIAARWVGDLPGIADSKTVCYHVLSTTSDEQGRFSFPAWEKDANEWQRKIKRGSVYLFAYKRGYAFVNTTADNTVYLKPFQGTREERFTYLSHTAVSCSADREIEVNLLPLYKALYEEARALAETKEERLKALYRLRDVERVQLGSDKAWENFRQRQRELQ